MHYQLRNDDYFENIRWRLRDLVPEFESIFEDDDIYPILGEFGRFMVENHDSESVFKKGAEFINEALEKGGEDSKTAICLQTFEQIQEDEVATKRVLNLLSQNALEIFKEHCI
ncbi:hypothetical protein ACE5IS_19580 [Leptospira wolffii]|uniref:DUF7674 domain-containing protein n=1 Tax=Leptospira wolffii TaxID=409998 RepID=A0ABV5BTK7_9LEPT